MVFCNIDELANNNIVYDVTILILIDGFLQYKEEKMYENVNKGSQSLF